MIAGNSGLDLTNWAMVPQNNMSVECYIGPHYGGPEQLRLEALSGASHGVENDDPIIFRHLRMMMGDGMSSLFLDIAVY